ncbi:MAG TPA: fatty acyl-AMP ligase [Vicinamibacterales bacterium]|nr:fatty acyl-AMP ligase [Vicinamibacterales bacterium]
MTLATTLPEALARAANSSRGFRFLNARSGETLRPHADLYNGALRVAGSLAAMGLGTGDLVAIIVADPESFLLTLFGASLAGVVPASLYPPATTSDLPSYLEATMRVLRSCQARGVVTSASLLPHIEALRGSCPDLKLVVPFDALQGPAMTKISTPSPSDIAFVQFTSGSTATPKGVVITHRNLSANITAFTGPHGVNGSSEDVVVSWLPLYHDMGLVGMALGSLYRSADAVLMTPEMFVKRPIEWLRAMSRYKATVSFAPNFAYDLAIRRVKDGDIAELDLSAWRVAGCGAEPIHASTLSAFAEKFHVCGFRETSFQPSYGLAEVVLAATMSRCGRPLQVEQLLADDLAVQRVATRANGSRAETMTVVACGEALPEHDVRIVDESGRPLGERHIGEIVLSGPSVSPGYYNDPDTTRATIRNGQLFTGDLGYLSNGELFVCGRMKDLIIVNGRKYHPQDLEWGVADLAGIRRGRVVAFGTTSDTGPDRTVVVAEPSGTVPPRELTDAIRRRIVDVCGLVVDDVVLVPSGTVARTTSGKVKRSATKMLYERGDLATTAAATSGA